MTRNKKQLEIFDLENRFGIRFSNIIDDEVYRLRLSKDEYTKLKIDIYRNTKINVPTDLSMISTIDVQSEISLKIREQINQFASKQNISYQLPTDHYSEVIDLKQKLSDRKTRSFQNINKNDISRMSETLYYFGGLEKNAYLGKLYTMSISEIGDIKDLKAVIEECRKYGVTERTIEGSLYSRISRNPEDLADAERIYQTTYKNDSESLLSLHKNKANSEIEAFNEKLKKAEEFVRLGEKEKAIKAYKEAEKLCNDYQMLAALSESIKNNTNDRTILNGILSRAIYHSSSSPEYTRIAEVYSEMAEYGRAKKVFKKAIYVSKDYKELRDVFLAVGKSMSVQEIKCSIMRECMQHIKQNEAKYLQDNENRKELADILEIYTGRNENTENLLKEYIAERKRLEKEANKKSKKIKENVNEDNGTVIIDGDVRTHAEAENMGLGDNIKYGRNISASEMGKAALSKEQQMSEMGTETILVEGQTRTMSEVEAINAADKARYDKNINAAELSSVEQKKEDLLPQEPVREDKEENLKPNVKVTPW